MQGNVSLPNIHMSKRGSAENLDLPNEKAAPRPPRYMGARNRALSSAAIKKGGAT